ncbi:Hepatocyte growth factor-regulated tyrosine kinase substrate [Varanus komodoensis]|nr:Hepatocyte growth factor-regulated tyrosine kinase substrate [Varanus komodoensis]
MGTLESAANVFKHFSMTTVTEKKKKYISSLYNSYCFNMKAPQMAKYAVGAIKKKVNDKNPHVALYALEVLESVVKNCGQTVHDEVANKQTMEELKELLKRQVEANVRNKILYLIQAWAHAFRNEPKYKVVQDTYQIMKVEGHVFPEFKESDAMFAAERAPDWVDAEECHRCRVQFGVHHCRACGQIFCGKCSSKYSTIPKFGIEKEVRVCEPCYEHLNKVVQPQLSACVNAALPVTEWTDRSFCAERSSSAVDVTLALLSAQESGRKGERHHRAASRVLDQPSFAAVPGKHLAILVEDGS